MRYKNVLVSNSSVLDAGRVKTSWSEIVAEVVALVNSTLVLLQQEHDGPLWLDDLTVIRLQAA